MVTATPVPSPFFCKAYSVSGAQYQTPRMGTYVASGTCDGQTLYECVDCDSSWSDYLYYNAQGQWWLIGPEGCGSTSVGLYGSGSGPPELASQWLEWSGSDWVETSTITVGCEEATFAPTATPAPTATCPIDYVADCSGDGDCCPESWIGDSLCDCLLYTSPSPRDKRQARMPSSA